MNPDLRDRPNRPSAIPDQFQISRTSNPMRENSRQAADMVQLMWIRAFLSIYQRLYMDIIREISSYVPEAFILYIQGDSLHKFFPAARTSRFFLNTELANCSLPFEIFALLDDEKIALKFSSYAKFPNYRLKDSMSLFHIYDKGKLVFPQRYEGHIRSGQGLLYDSVRKALYFFGGLKRSGNSTKKSDVFDPNTSQFSKLAVMSEPRNRPGCCWHAEIAYICGGCEENVDTTLLYYNRMTVEIFNPRHGTYAMFCSHEMPYSSHDNFYAQSFLAAWHKDRLVIVSNLYHWIYDSTQHKCYLLKEHADKKIWVLGAVTRGNLLYYVDADTCCGVDMETGEIHM